ncbi:MAG: thioesterase family protein [Planctomycetaceae bacterium]
MSAIFEYQHTVCDEEIDGNGHVNNLAYLKWMQSAAVAHSAALGWPMKRYRESGSSWVARKHTIEYLKPAFLGETILIQTWIAGLRKATSLRKYLIRRVSDETLLAKAETDWAFVGIEHHVPRRVPVEIRDAFPIVNEQDEPAP